VLPHTRYSVNFPLHPCILVFTDRVVCLPAGHIDCLTVPSSTAYLPTLLPFSFAFGLSLFAAIWSPGLPGRAALPRFPPLPSPHRFCLLITSFSSCLFRHLTPLFFLVFSSVSFFSLPQLVLPPSSRRAPLFLFRYLLSDPVVEYTPGPPFLFSHCHSSASHILITLSAFLYMVFVRFSFFLLFAFHSVRWQPRPAHFNSSAPSFFLL